jgi:hypothetical protein
MSRPKIDDAKMLAGIQLLERTGAREFRIGYSHDDDGEPTVWYAVASWRGGAEASGALDPVTAVLRLCEQVIDGGTCTHCQRPTIFDFDDPSDDAHLALAAALGCCYAWDPELATFRRGCEGDRP